MQYAVIAPAACPAELRDGHELDSGNAGIGNPVEIGGDAIERAIW